MKLPPSHHAYVENNISFKKLMLNINISINSGIFQGDSLSPILFFVALIPLSKLLNKTTNGYKIYDNTRNNLLYVVDLKLFAKNDQQLQHCKTI